MSDTMQTSGLIVIAQNYKDDIVRQINRTATALKLFQPEVGEGPNAAWVAEGDGAVVESFSEGADAANFGSDSQTGALLTWARYRGLIHVSGTALAVAATSRTPLGNQRLWARNMLNSVEKLAKTLDTDFYTGAGGNALVGLDTAIGSISGTYAGIDRGSNSFWQASLFNAAGPASAITFAQIRGDLAAIKVASGYRPDVALVSPNTYNKIASLFDPLKFYTISTEKVAVRGREVDLMLDGGRGGLNFDGCIFVEDAWAPDNAIYYLNTAYVAVEHLPVDMSNLGGDETAMLQMVDGLEESVPLGLAFEMLAKNGDSEKAQMKVYPQLVVRRPNACGKRLNIL